MKKSTKQEKTKDQIESGDVKYYDNIPPFEEFKKIVEEIMLEPNMSLGEQMGESNIIYYQNLDEETFKKAIDKFLNVGDEELNNAR